MNLEQKKDQLLHEISLYSKSKKECQKEYDDLKDCIQPSVEDLYCGIEKFFTIEIDDTRHEHILGGDDRSRPWSEMRGCLKATIKINEGFYLDEDQENVIKDYVNKIHILDKIEFFNSKHQNERRDFISIIS